MHTCRWISCNRISLATNTSESAPRNHGFLADHSNSELRQFATNIYIFSHAMYEQSVINRVSRLSFIWIFCVSRTLTFVSLGSWSFGLDWLNADNLVRRSDVVTIGIVLFSLSLCEIATCSLINLRARDLGVQYPLQKVLLMCVILDPDLKQSEL